MEDTLKKLQQANPSLKIKAITDPAFTRYGRVLTDFDPSEIIARAKAILPTTDRVVYQTSVPELEEPCAFNEALYQEVYGGMPMQVGWCYGRNRALGGVEYHKGIEINVCLVDTVFVVGSLLDIEFGDEISYDGTKPETFFAPAGTVAEFAPWNLHLAPCQAYENADFATLVYLPKGTNERLPYEVTRRGESRLLLAVNKWLLAHESAKGMIEHGIIGGMHGPQIVVTPV